VGLHSKRANQPVKPTADRTLPQYADRAQLCWHDELSLQRSACS
jgi:hypothetical protein